METSGSAGSTLSGNQHPDLAEKRLEAWNREFADFRVNRKRRALDALDEELRKLGPDVREGAADLLAGARESLEKGDADAAAGPLLKLSDLVHRHRPEVMELFKEQVGAAPAEAANDPDPVAPAFGRSRSNHARRRARWARGALSGVSLVLAVLGGLAALYFGKPFGAAADYLLAAVWGFGTDSTVQNADVLIKKLRGPAA